jgi:hypothetical protein
MAQGVVPSPFSCSPTAAQTDLPLRRLSHNEYLNTVQAFIAAAAPMSAMDVESSLATDLAQVPADTIVPLAGEHHGGFSRMDQTVQQAMVDATYNVAVDAAKSLTAHLQELMGTCATDADTSNDAKCLSDLVARLAPLAQRHPLTTDDAQFLIDTAGTTPVDPAAVADVLALMMLQPGFLYHLESGDQQVGDDLYALDAYELAARLSYHFWEAPPDDALRAAAADGSLLNDDVYSAQLTRLTSDPRTDATIDTFFTEWFRLAELGSLTSRIGDPVYDAFAGPNAPSTGLRQAMFDEVLDAARYNAHHGGTLDALVGDTRNFAKSAELAGLYGTTAWDGTSAPQPLPAARSGLFTRGAFLANDSANTRPVMKGLRIRNALMCDTVPPPPSNVKAVPPDLAPDLTTREVLEKLTMQPNTACISCHGVLLNPLGFASENFDALGRSRSVQTLYDTQGNVTEQKPVDTTSVPRVTLDDLTQTGGIAEVTSRIVTSQRVDSCFARQYFRFAFRRAEDMTADGCSLRAFDDSARAGSLAQALGAAALQPQFKTRRIVP